MAAVSKLSPEARKHITMGGPDEATYYITECGPAWHQTPGAVEWLAALATTPKPKRTTPKAIH
jgi:hypothetical protein